MSLAINPLVRLHEASWTQLCVCPHCHKEFVVGSGAVCYCHYTDNGVPKYGLIAFCSVEHLLEGQPAQGNA